MPLISPTILYFTIPTTLQYWLVENFKCNALLFSPDIYWKYIFRIALYSSNFHRKNIQILDVWDNVPLLWTLCLFLMPLMKYNVPNFWRSRCFNNFQDLFIWNSKFAIIPWFVKIDLLLFTSLLPPRWEI